MVAAAVTGWYLSAPAAAEVGAAVSVFSDKRFRGYSLSSGDPVATIDVSYDHPNGLYAAVSASAVASSDDGIRPLGVQVSSGYAKRLSGGASIDVGVVQSRYTRYSSREDATSYTEVYAGLSRGVLSSRIHFSPHYFGRSKTLYGEVDATVSPMRKLRLDGHVGLLVPLDYDRANGDDRAQYDWRLGAAREVGRRGSVHLIATGGGPGRDYYAGRPRSRTALIVGMSLGL